MTPAYTIKLGLTTRRTSIRATKIDDSPLHTYDMISVKFLLQDIRGKVWFFEKTFLLVNTCIKVVLKIPFLALNNANF